MLSFNPQKENCSGCSACFSACPVRCITMKQDDEGFLYPEASAECIGCGICKKVCPIFHSQNIKNDFHKPFVALSLDQNVWKKSASGGAFSEICNSWGDNDTIFIGAAWEKLQVNHVGVIGINSIGPLRKSKYIASDLCNTFVQAKQYLDSGGKVLFCGTPCQVAGLRSFLNKDYEHLLTIDLICHGVGSPKVFKECLKDIEKTEGETIVGYEFRSKKKYYESDYLSCVYTKSRSIYYLMDRYHQLFMSQLCLRPSCSHYCKFRNPNRQGDITIADFKGLSDIFPQFEVKRRNYSTIVVNSLKGASIIPELEKRMELHPYPLELVIKYNPFFAEHTELPSERNIFFSAFCVNPGSAIDRWTKPVPYYKPTWKRLFFNHAPKFLRKVIIRLTR